MFCSKCGKEIPNNSKFCTKCGASIAVQKKQDDDQNQSANSNQNVNNNQNYDSNQNYIGNQGQADNKQIKNRGKVAPERKTYVEEREPSIWTKWYTYVLILLIILSIGLTAFLVIRTMGNKSDNGDITTEEPKNSTIEKDAKKLAKELGFSFIGEEDGEYLAKDDDGVIYYYNEETDDYEAEEQVTVVEATPEPTEIPLGDLAENDAKNKGWNYMPEGDHYYAYDSYENKYEYTKDNGYVLIEDHVDRIVNSIDEQVNAIDTFGYDFIDSRFITEAPYNTCLYWCTEQGGTKEDYIPMRIYIAARHSGINTDWDIYYGEDGNVIKYIAYTSPRNRIMYFQDGKLIRLIDDNGSVYDYDKLSTGNTDHFKEMEIVYEDAASRNKREFIGYLNDYAAKYNKKYKR